jgi:hypothetical protein
MCQPKASITRSNRQSPGPATSPLQCRVRLRLEDELLSVNRGDGYGAEGAVCERADDREPKGRSDVPDVLVHFLNACSHHRGSVRVAPNAGAAPGTNASGLSSGIQVRLCHEKDEVELVRMEQPVERGHDAPQLVPQ